MLNEIFMPVVQATYANLNQSVDPNDMDTLNELRILRRCYYEFLSCLITNSLTGELEESRSSSCIDESCMAATTGRRWAGSRPVAPSTSVADAYAYVFFIGRSLPGKIGVLTSPANAPHSDQVLATIIGGAADPSDVKAQKVCFSMLTDLAKSWFGKPGVGVAGFDELVMAQFVPTCFQSILKVDFDPDDAWVSWLGTTSSHARLAFTCCAFLRWRQRRGRGGVLFSC